MGFFLLCAEGFWLGLMCVGCCWFRFFFGGNAMNVGPKI